MPIVALNGLRVHYQVSGNGPDVVMIHGLASDLAFWYLTAAPALAKRYRVTVYDLRGHGYTGMPAEGYTSGHLAADLLALVDHLGVERAHLVGHSFGGSVALHFAAQNPGRVRTITLADARMHALQPPLPQRQSGHWQTIRAALAQQGLNLPETTPIVVYTVLEELLRTPPAEAPTGVAANAAEAGATAGRGDGIFWSYGSGKVARRKLARWIQLVETTTARVDLNVVDGLPREVIGSVSHPTLAVYGERSGCLESARGLEGLLPALTSILIPGEGHLHPLTRPGAFLGHLLPFLEARGDS